MEMEKRQENGSKAQGSQQQGQSGGSNKASSATNRTCGSDGVALPMSLIKALRGKSSGENGSSSSGGGGSGNNSDNSALISLGNTSFGFNFDSDERSGSMNGNSRENSEGGDSDGNNSGNGQPQQRGRQSQARRQAQLNANPSSETAALPASAPRPATNIAPVRTNTCSSHNAAAAAAVANLQSIASAYTNNGKSLCARCLQIFPWTQDLLNNDLYYLSIV
jgi:hypothetical protein